MKRLIIIPTWAGHFDKNITFLKSCIEFKIDVPIKFVVSDLSEKAELTDRINQLQFSEILNFKIVEIETIIQKFKPEIALSDIEDIKLLHKKFKNIYNAKHPYQAIKKIYSLRYFDYDQALLLDSECAFIRPTNVNELFDEYFENPRIFYTPHNKISKNLQIITDASLKSLEWADVTDVRTNWVFESLYWMIDKNIINQMFDDIETNIGRDLYTEYTTNAGEIFEMITYYSYIYIHNDKFKYNFINYYDVLKTYITDDFENYIKRKSNIFGGMLEFMFEFIDDSKYDAIYQIVNDYKIRFCRLGNSDLHFYKKVTKNSKYLNMIVSSENLTQILKFLNE
jgi:hypothetical protein